MTKTWVTAPMIFPFWMMGAPLIPWTIPPVGLHQLRVVYMKDKGLVLFLRVIIDLVNRNMVSPHFPVHSEEDDRLILFNLLLIPHRILPVIPPLGGWMFNVRKFPHPDCSR